MRRLIRVAVPAAALAVTAIGAGPGVAFAGTGVEAMPAAVAAPAPTPTVSPSPTPSPAGTVFVELNPSTVEAGEELGVRASCAENLAAASVTAEPFGSVTVRPEFGFLTATVTVPAGTERGTYPVRLNCPDGPDATTTLRVVARTRPSRGPATGFGGTAGESPGPWLITGGLATMAAGLGLGVLTMRRRRVPVRR